MNQESQLKFPYNLKVNLTTGAQVRCVGDREDIWRLEIPPGSSNRYRLAQLDDYRSLPRRAFLWSPPLRLSLYARASSKSIPGTWGFGLWNDPFSMGVLGGAGMIRLPVLPNAAWFFFASPLSYLSVRDDLPAQGWLASTFRSPIWPSILTPLWMAALPFLLIPPCMRLIRRLISRFVIQDTAGVLIDPTELHLYELIWRTESIELRANSDLVLLTNISPIGPLGLVIWVDNQYAAVLPSGHLRYGFLPNSEPAWIEFSQLSIGQI